MDLSRLKLSKSDLDVLSCVTPSLSRRIQNQLFSKLPPTQARKLSRTLSMKSNYENGFTKNNAKTCIRSFSVTNASEDNMTEKVTDGHLLQHHKELPVSNAVSDLVQIAAHNDLCNKLATLSSSQYNSRDKFDRSMSTNENNVPNISENQRCFHGASSVRSTPERSVLGSSFNRSSTMDHVEESKVNHHTLLKSLERLPPKCEVKSSLSDYLNNKSGNSKTISYVRCANLMKTPQRKVSRFLRPDFFDTPRDESVYCKEKRERELETQKVLQEIRCRRERSLDRSIQLSDNNDMNSILCLNADKQVDHTSDEKTNITLDSAPVVTLQTNINKNKSNVSNGNDVFEKNLSNKADRFEETESSNSSPKNINIINPDSIPKDTEFVTVNKKTASPPKLNKVSKLIRPKSYAGSKSSFLTEKTTASSLDIAAFSTKRDEVEITIKSDNPKTFTKSEEKIIDVEKTKILVAEQESEVKTHEKAKTAKGFFKSIGQKIEKFRNADSNVKSVRKLKNNSDIQSSPNNSVPKQVLEDNKKSKDDLVLIEIPLKDLQPTISSGSNITTNLVVVKPKVKSSSKKLVKVKVMNKKLKASSNIKNGKKENKKNAAADKETLTLTNNLIKEQEKNCIETRNIINVNCNVNGLDNHITTDRATATRINEVIHSLKERSLPQEAMGLTESGLIRRAVSVEDMSGHLQHSRRSVSKVLNLFNKKSENNCDAGPKILKHNSEIYESKVAHKSTAVRPNSLIFPNSKVKRLSQQYTKTKSDSALTLPITEHVNMGDSQPLSEQVNKGKSVTGCSSVCANGITFKEGSMPLTLDFSKLPVSKFNVLKKIHAGLKISETNNFCDGSSKSVTNKNLELDSSSDLSKNTVMPNYDIGSNTALFSCADSELFDNWSVYSDLNTKNTNSLCSPCSEAVSPNFDSRSDKSDQLNCTPRVSSPLSELSSPVCENAESTIERIHRKSFYPRFNEKKQKRVSEIVGPGAKDYYIKSLLDYKFEDPSQLSKHRRHYSSHHQPNDIRTSLTNMPRSSGFSKSPHDFVDGYKTYSHTRLKEPHNNYLDRTTSFVDPTARNTQLVPSVYPGNRCSWLIPKESSVRLGQNNHSGSKDIGAARDTFGWRDYLDRTPSVPISVKRRAKSHSDNKFVASDSSELP